MSGQRAIVSGATGALGTALVRELVRRGAEVLVLVHPNSPRRANLPVHPGVRLLDCGMEDFSRLENSSAPYDVFYHLAWAGTSGAGRNDMYLQNANVRYALDAVGMAKRFGCRRFVGAGSQAEYGRVSGKLTADTPQRPEMGYGYAKLCAGEMTRDYAHALGISHVWIRILSLYGPKDGPQSMVMSTIRKLAAGEIPEFTPAEQRWDYLYSGDAAEAFADLADRGRDGGIYVLGSGTARPLREYIEEIRDVVRPGAALGIGKLSYAKNQVMYLCADTGDIFRDTGWMPKTPFPEGIRAILADQ
ncbi:NAD-dependent epimerase/dehydratase family protein [Clostridium vitabionis]|uniref:NAD-dependent epimerase/dehydratase family protein n=1 Tax=Clostridium vitabionis TaxID=2784388 RepID=UPI00188BE58D|nr:NAD-dependent epimerase/dehydratase family protein [Clostridium vitabionis]